MEIKKGDKLKVICMKDEPSYTGRVGIVYAIDGIGQIHGTWGGCALIPGVDEYEKVDE